MASARFSVLGSLELSSGGQPLEVRGGMQRRLLGLLLRRANHVVSAERLADDLWNGAPPPSAAKTLQSHVVRLRESLGTHRHLLETKPSGYLLRATSDTLDVLRFEQLVARGRRAASAGVPEVAAAMLGEALILWRGTAYADLQDCDALAREALRLADLQLSTLEAAADAALADGRGADLVVELEGAVSAHPTRETLWRQLALALYRSGRQAEALGTVERLRRHLRDEFGVDPSPEVLDVELAMLRQDPALSSRPEPRRAPLPTALSADNWPLVGRERELAWLQRAWADAARSSGRLVLVRGTAGIGRSRLLAELARDLAARGVAVHFSSGGALGSALRPGGVPLSVDETVGVLCRTADLMPMLVVLDDLHLAPDGLAALHAALPVIGGLPVLVVGSFDSAAETPSIRELLDQSGPDGPQVWDLPNWPTTRPPSWSAAWSPRWDRERR